MINRTTTNATTATTTISTTITTTGKVNSRYNNITTTMKRTMTRAMTTTGKKITTSKEITTTGVVAGRTTTSGRVEKSFGLLHNGVMNKYFVEKDAINARAAKRYCAKTKTSAVVSVWSKSNRKGVSKTYADMTTYLGNDKYRIVSAAAYQLGNTSSRTITEVKQR